MFILGQSILGFSGVILRRSYLLLNPSGGNADIALHQISFKDVFAISWRPDGAARAATRRIVRGPRPLSATGLPSAAQGSEKRALREIVGIV